MKYQNKFLTLKTLIQFSNGSIFKMSCLLIKIVESSLDSKNNHLWNKSILRKKSLSFFKKSKAPIYKMFFMCI